MKVSRLHSQGRSIREIADELGYSRGLVHKTLSNGEPPVLQTQLVSWTGFAVLKTDVLSTARSAEIGYSCTRVATIHGPGRSLVGRMAQPSRIWLPSRFADAH